MSVLLPTLKGEPILLPAFVVNQLNLVEIIITLKPLAVIKG